MEFAEGTRLYKLFITIKLLKLNRPQRQGAARLVGD